MIKYYVLCALLCTAVASTAHAAPTHQWHVNASSCIPDNTAIQSNLYLNSGGSTGFASGKSGDIILYCPVPPLPFTPTALELGYFDSVGSSTNHVVAKYIKLDSTTDSLTTIKTCDSQNQTALGTYQTCAQTFMDTLDTLTYSYYIRVDIIRNGTTQTEVAAIITLSD